MPLAKDRISSDLAGKNLNDHPSFSTLLDNQAPSYIQPYVTPISDSLKITDGAVIVGHQKML